MRTFLRIVRMVVLPPEDIWSLRGVHYIFARSAMLGAMFMFWYMAQHELIGPWLGGLAAVILSLLLIAVPFWEAFGLRLASWLTGGARFGFQCLWVLCVVLTFGGHLYLVSSLGGQDRFRQESADQLAEVTLSQGKAAVSTEALLARLPGEQATVDRHAAELARVSAWRGPLAAAIANGGTVPELRAVQIEVSARREARGESPIVADGRAKGSTDCQGVCGETAEAIEREISLVASSLAEAEAVVAATNADITLQTRNEAGGALRQAMEDAEEIASVETTTRNMRSFMDTWRRLGSTVGLVDKEAPTLSDAEANELAATASDIAFLLLVTVVNLISWTNNAGHGGGAPNIARARPYDLPPHEFQPQPHRTALAAPESHRPPPAPTRQPPPQPRGGGSGAAPPAHYGGGHSPAPSRRPDPDKSRLGAEGALAALDAKIRSKPH